VDRQSLREISSAGRWSVWSGWGAAERAVPEVEPARTRRAIDRGPGQTLTCPRALPLHRPRTLEERVAALPPLRGAYHDQRLTLNTLRRIYIRPHDMTYSDAYRRVDVGIHARCLSWWISLDKVRNPRFRSTGHRAGSEATYISNCCTTLLANYYHGISALVNVD
jgi:hypothetical protein